MAVVNIKKFAEGFLTQIDLEEEVRSKVLDALLRYGAFFQSTEWFTAFMIPGKVGQDHLYLVEHIVDGECVYELGYYDPICGDFFKAPGEILNTVRWRIYK